MTKDFRARVNVQKRARRLRRQNAALTGRASLSLVEEIDKQPKVLVKPAQPSLQALERAGRADQ